MNAHAIMFYLTVVLLKLLRKVKTMTNPLSRYTGAEPTGFLIRFIAAFLLSSIIFVTAMAGPKNKLLLVAHRGASGYAPEHTLAAYKLAIEQGADFVEQDLQLTKDGQFICLHDPDLARTTNVADVFPNRATMRDIEETGKPHRGWYTIDFTLAEIKQLDAGSWFNRANPFAANPDYAGQRVPTLEETIKLVGKRAGLYIELKHYTFYKQMGYDTAQKLAAILKAHGFDSDKERERIFIQSFFKDGLLKMKEVAPRYRRVQLLPMEDAGRKEDSAIVTPSLAKEIAAYAQGAGPSKTMLKDSSDVAIFHVAGLVVHPYTFRGGTLASLRKPLDETQPNGSTARQIVIADIQRYVAFGIDGGFTDYPALWRAATTAPASKQNVK